MATIRETAENAAGDGIEVTEVGGAPFAFGYANGHWGEDGEMKMLGIPVDLGVGFALTGTAMFGGLGEYREHGVTIGSGALVRRNHLRVSLRRSVVGRPLTVTFAEKSGRVAAFSVMTNMRYAGEPGRQERH